MLPLSKRNNYTGLPFMGKFPHLWGKMNFFFILRGIRGIWGNFSVQGKIMKKFLKNAILSKKLPFLLKKLPFFQKKLLFYIKKFFFSRLKFFFPIKNFFKKSIKKSKNSFSYFIS